MARKADPIPACSDDEEEELMKNSHVLIVRFSAIGDVADNLLGKSGTRQVSRSTGELSDAKSRLEALKAEEKELNFALEQKNDIRLVEQIATERIGMVKEGSV